MSNYSINTTLMTDDNSWSNIKCDWETFTFEEELTSRRETCKIRLEQIAETPLVFPDESPYADVENVLNDFEMKHKIALTDNYDVLQNSENLKSTYIALKEQCKQLTTICENLTNTKNRLETEISNLTSDQKLNKAAYQKALQMYEKYLDFKVSIIENSEHLVIAFVKFNFAKDMKPIKVTINREERKIIEMDTEGLMQEEISQHNLPYIDIFYNIRQKLINTVL